MKNMRLLTLDKKIVTIPLIFLGIELVIISFLAWQQEFDYHNIKSAG